MSDPSYQNRCNANYGPEDIPRYETCGTCRGAGYSNHPDSGEICETCGGSGGVERGGVAMSDLARELRDDYPAVDVTTAVFSRDFAGIGCCVIPQDRVLAVISELEAHAELVKALEELNGAMRFVLAFYEPGQRYLDTNAWKSAEASARDAHEKATTALATLTARKVG